MSILPKINLETFGASQALGPQIQLYICVYCPKCMNNNKPVTLASVMHELTDLKDRFEKISFLAEDVKRVNKTEDARNNMLLSNIVRNTEDLKSDKQVISKSLAKLAVSADRTKLAAGETHLNISGRRGYDGYDPEKTVITGEEN